MEYPDVMSEARPTILSVCVRNAGRSQMAAALARELAGERVAVCSAGSDPAEAFGPAAAEAMAEVGIELGAAAPRLLETDAVRAPTAIVAAAQAAAQPPALTAQGPPRWARTRAPATSRAIVASVAERHPAG